MSCHAPNDKLLPDGLSIEMYYCELEFGHKGPHKCSGYGPWYDDAYHEANDYVSKDAEVQRTFGGLTVEAIDALPIGSVVQKGQVIVCRFLTTTRWGWASKDGSYQSHELAGAILIAYPLPADADELADELVQDADKLEATYESSYGPVPLVSKLRRAAAILRGEP